jgi:hypothetical protein
MSSTSSLFELSPRSRDYQERLKAFMDEHIYPNELTYYEEEQTTERWTPRPIIEK